MDKNQGCWFSVLLTSVVVAFSVLLWRRKKNRLPLPPRPPAWPVVGNLFLLGEKPNEALFAISEQYGPLMTLFLGMKTTVVASSAAMVKEVLKTHDSVLAGQTVKHSMKVLSYHKSSIIWGQNESHWQKLRHISTSEFFSPKKLQTSEHIKRYSVFQMIRLIFEENREKGKSVNLGDLMIHTAMNTIGNLMFSTKVFDPDNPDYVEFTEALNSSVKLVEKPRLADFFHGLGFWIFMVLTELLMAGSDTSTAAIVWAMVELICSPPKMKRLQLELEKAVGMKRRVEECDTEHLPYLHAMVKEVL